IGLDLGGDPGVGYRLLGIHFRSIAFCRKRIGHCDGGCADDDGNAQCDAIENEVHDWSPWEVNLRSAERVATLRPSISPTSLRARRRIDAEQWKFPATFMQQAFRRGRSGTADARCLSALRFPRTCDPRRRVDKCSASAIAAACGQEAKWKPTLGDVANHRFNPGRQSRIVAPRICRSPPMSPAPRVVLV